MPEFIEKKLSDLFTAVNGNPKYTKTFCNENKGEYIVYTGTTIGIFGSISNADQTQPNLTFTTDGEYAGTLEYITDSGYCIGGHRSILKPIAENLDLLYFKYTLQPLFFENVKRGDVPSLRFKGVKDKTVLVPVLKNGDFDLQFQTEQALKYQEVERQKESLLLKIKDLKNTKIVLDKDDTVEYKEVSLIDLFLPKGGDPLLTKTYCHNNKGKYPVYSGSTSKDIYASLNTSKYEGEYLTWVIDGLAGYLMVINGAFSLTCHRGILLPTENCRNIDLMYVKYVLEPIFRNRTRGRIDTDGKNEYTALKPKHIKDYNDSIPVPIDSNGEFDLAKQQEIASKYQALELYQEKIYFKIQELSALVIE